MIQFTDDQAPNGRHLCVQHTYGWEDVSSFLIQQGEGEVYGDPAARRRGGGSNGDLGRASPSSNESERGVTRGEGGARDLGAAALPPPTIYRAPRGAPALGDPISKGGGGQGGDLPPKSGGAPPPLGFPTLGAGGGPWGAHQPTRGWFPSHFSPWGPPG